MSIYNKSSSIPLTGLTGSRLLNGTAKDQLETTNGTATNISWVNSVVGYQAQVADFVSGSSAKVVLGNIGNTKSVSFWINLDTTTESIFEGSANDKDLSVSGGTLSYPEWDNVYVDLTDTDTITGSVWHHVVVTSTTNVDCSALTLGLINATYGDFTMGMFKTYTTELTESERQSLYYEGGRWLGQDNYPELFSSVQTLQDFKGDAQDVLENNDGTVTGADLTTDEFGSANFAYDFVSTNSDKIVLGNVGNIKSVLMRINIDTTTENIFEGSANDKELYASSGTLNYPDWDNVYVDGVDTDTIDAGAWRTILLTSTTNVDCSALTIGLINATYGDMTVSYFATFTDDISSYAIGFHDLLSNGYPYPRTKRAAGFMTDGLIGHWYGDSLGYDQSGFGNNGTVANITDRRVMQHTGGVYNGSTSKTTISGFDTTEITSTGDLTLTGRFRSTKSGSQSIFSGGAGNAFVGRSVKLYIWSTGDVLSVIFPESGPALKRISNANAVDDSNRHFASVTKIGTAIKLYLDGILVGSDTLNRDTGSGGVSWIGVDDAVHFIQGNLSDTRFYNRGLSAIEINSLYHFTYIQ